jgi:hypothetical protein
VNKVLACSIIRVSACDSDADSIRLGGLVRLGDYGDSPCEGYCIVTAGAA